MKFDTSTIDGFENMSDADKVTALLGVDLPDPVDTKNLVKKEDFDKVMSEASSYKKQLKEKMTAEETAAAEAKAAQEKLQNDYNALLKENTISKNVAKYIALGYDEKLAKSTAEALFDGDMETVFANAAKANQALADKLKADLMRNSPRPSGAGTSTEEESEYMASNPPMPAVCRSLCAFLTTRNARQARNSPHIPRKSQKKNMSHGRSLTL